MEINALKSSLFWTVINRGILNKLIILQKAPKVITVMCLIVFCNAVFSQSTSKICTLIRFTLFSNYPEQGSKKSFVLLPYRFTLFSNREVQTSHYSYVLLPYRFTLFSNRNGGTARGLRVLLPYRFTLFSNALTSTMQICIVLLPYRFTLFSNIA